MHVTLAVIAALLTPTLQGGLPLLRGPLQEEKKEKPQEPEKKTHEVIRGNLVPSLDLKGTFEPSTSHEVKLKFDAYSGSLEILEVVKLGARVKKGDILLLIDPKPLVKAITASENELRVARASLEKTEADYEAEKQADAIALRHSEDSLAYSKKALQLFEEVNGKQMLKMNEMMVKFREDSVKDTEEELKQLLAMYKSEELTNATAEIVVKRTKRSLERSRIYLEMAREDAKITREVSFPRIRKNYLYSVEEATHALDGLRRAQTLGAIKRDAARVRARTSLKDQEKKLEELKRDLKKFTVRASMAGRIFYGPFQGGTWPNAVQLKKKLRVGEKASANQPLLTISGVAGRLLLRVNEKDYFDVKAGQSVTIKPGALPGTTLKGKVTSRDIVSLSGAVFQVHIALDKPRKSLLPGMKAKLTITGEELKDVLIVPTKAITIEEATKGTVTLLKDGEEEKREVTLGKSDGDNTVIRKGLEPGDRVVLPE